MARNKPLCPSCASHRAPSGSDDPKDLCTECRREHKALQKAHEDHRLLLNARIEADRQKEVQWECIYAPARRAYEKAKAEYRERLAAFQRQEKASMPAVQVELFAVSDKEELNTFLASLGPENILQLVAVGNGFVLVQYSTRMPKRPLAGEWSEPEPCLEDFGYKHRPRDPFV